MSEAKILVVDDEKNIRLTVAQALETLGHQVKTAVNGEEALQRLQEDCFDLMLVDLKMPGMDGMTVLERAIALRPELQAIVVSAHGTVENAVEAMKLGAMDFIQKPFTPNEIRELVGRVLQRPHLENTEDYDSSLERAKSYAAQRKFDEAIAQVKKTIGIAPDRPEGFNFLGELEELCGDRLEAIKKYRAALDLDPTYRRAQTNLDRATTDPKHRPSF